MFTSHRHNDAKLQYFYEIGHITTPHYISNVANSEQKEKCKTYKFSKITPNIIYSDGLF